jgi:hypothetical protein
LEIESLSLKNLKNKIMNQLRLLQVEETILKKQIEIFENDDNNMEDIKIMIENVFFFIN